MIENEAKLWRLLSKNDVAKFHGSRIEHPEILFDKHSGPFIIFNLNINRALLFYPDLCRTPKPNKHYIDFQYLSLSEIALVFIITSMEVYLVDTFKNLASRITVGNVDKRKLVDFIKEFRLEKEYFATLKEHGNNNIPLSEITPERIDLQQKDKCRIAYSLIDIDLPTVVDKEQRIWNKIFGNTKDSYLRTRHDIIHRGVSATVRYSQKMNISIVENAALDISNFVNHIDNVLISKYPKNEFPEVYPQPSK